MAVDYDPTDESPSNIRQIMSMESAVSGSVWSILKHASKVSNLRKMKTYYTQPSLGEDSDRTTSIGTLYVVKGRNPTTGAPLGKLFVDYSIELMTPQPEDPALIALAFRATSGSSASPFGSLNSYAGLMPYGVIDNYKIDIPNGTEGMIIVNSTATAPGPPSFTAGVDGFGGFRLFTADTVDGYMQIILFSTRSHGDCSIEYHLAPGISDISSFFIEGPVNIMNWSLSKQDYTDIVPWSGWLNRIQTSFRLKQYSQQVQAIEG